MRCMRDLGVRRGWYSNGKLVTGGHSWPPRTMHPGKANTIFHVVHVTFLQGVDAAKKELAEMLMKAAEEAKKEGEQSVWEHGSHGGARALVPSRGWQGC